jgi:hypothetical protein
VLDELWGATRSGSHAGRGFHYQDAVTTEVALRAWCGELPLRRIVPEGVEDLSLEFDTHWLHLQGKSRREHRGEFTLPDLGPVWQKLARSLAADETAHAGLVLERPLTVGAETGLERGLAEVGSNELKEAIGAAVKDVMDPGDFLARAHLLVMPSPEATAIELLASRLGLPPASCVAHYAILRGRLAQLADENGVRRADAPAAFTPGDIARVLEDVSESIDPSALEQAVREGVAELVDFVTPVHDGRFFSGIDVVVGHVVAGLPLERPEVERLTDGLTVQRVALAVGPSGAGKSALIWLAAFATRHNVRWYRVRRLCEDDVPALVRVVKGLKPSGAIVGFVVDNVGRDDRVGFDRLIEELREEPSARVLGACREEDLFMVRSARVAAQVRPVLGAALAKRLWSELHVKNETSWPEWREPFERSQGLLLEYGHLLTEGRRLPDTIAAQVDQRVREQRSLELEIMALVATADAYGADIDVTRLTAALGADGTEVKAALTRLADEHLLRERNGLLTGLHELRSRHVMDEIHRAPPPLLAESVRRVIALVSTRALQVFVTQLLVAGAVPDQVVIDALVVRFGRQADLQAIAAALQALRLVGFYRTASSWRAILSEEKVRPIDAGLIAHLVGHGADMEIFPEPVRRAVLRIRQLGEVGNPRRPLVEALGRQLTFAHTSDANAAVTVLAALGEAGTDVTVDAAQLARLVRDATLADIRLMLEAAYAVNPQLANAVADELGGSGALLERLEREHPWVRDAELATDHDGHTMVRAEYAYVAESAQPDPHDAVVQLCHYLAALAPAADIIVCRAIDAMGDTAGFGGVPIADKRIERRNLPSPADVARNRARGRAAAAAVAGLTETEYLLAVRDIIIRSRRLIHDAGNAWVRGRSPAPKLDEDAAALISTVRKLSPSPVATEATGPLDKGELRLYDRVGFIGTVIPNNLLPRLFEGEAVAPFIQHIADEVDKVAQLERWYLLEDPPVEELRALREDLIDLRAVADERVRGDQVAAAALAAAGRKGLSASADVARRAANTRMQMVTRQLEQVLSRAGFSAQVQRRPGEPDSGQWPDDDFLILVDVPTIYHWPNEVARSAALCRPVLSDRVCFLMAPVREAKVVASCGVKVVRDIFPDESVRDWPGLPLLKETLTDAIREGLAGLCEASGVIASMRRAELHNDEAAAIQTGFRRARQALERVSDLANGHDDRVVTETQSKLAGLIERVEYEAASLADGQPSDRGFAASLLAGMRGDSDEAYLYQYVIVGACIEWDTAPDGAWDRTKQALEET